jgi:hypothetical protein
MRAVSVLKWADFSAVCVIAFSEGNRMRATILALLIAFAVTPAMAENIPATQAAQHVGETATVVGTLSGYRFRGPKRPTYWNIDGAYPNNAFTAVIKAEDVGKFPNMSPLIGKTVAITGTIELYDGKPEIVLKDISQVQIAP